MEELYIVTGATGHLGGTIVRLLRAQGAEVRGLLLPGEQPPQGDGVAYYPGDCLLYTSLQLLFHRAVGEVDLGVLVLRLVFRRAAEQGNQAAQMLFPGAVSYTHLDVYKRQKQDRTFWAAAPQNFENAFWHVEQVEKGFGKIGKKQVALLYKFI